jgi:signal peptidase I
MLGVPLEWFHSKAEHDVLALVIVSDGEEEKTALISATGFMMVAAKDYVETPKERSVPKKRPLRSGFDFLFKVSGWAIVLIFSLTALLTFTNIIDTRVVLTGSMVPSINPGDVVFTLPASRLKPEIDDVIVYTGKRLDGTPVAPFAHRIIGGDLILGFEMKGDANPSADVQRPKLEDIEGVVFLIIPLLGKILNPQVLMLVFLSGFGISLIVGAFRDED